MSQRERLPSSPSLDEHHDWQGFSTDERELILERLRELEGSVKELRERMNSEAPGTVDVRRTDKGWRVRAPQWPAVAFALIALAGVLAWKAEKLVQLAKLLGK